MQTAPRDALAKHVIMGHSHRGTAAVSLTLIPHHDNKDNITKNTDGVDTQLLEDHIALINQYGATTLSSSSLVFPTGVQIASRIATLNQFIDGTLLQRHLSERTKASDHRGAGGTPKDIRNTIAQTLRYEACLLYTSDAADEEDSVDLGGRRIIKKKKRRVIE
eukprot:TRINITY_DN24441_c0_g2_i3.p1 TRINITY_DN24441_c0_g2~~TRINITY_DN24441_c0_g2_i3.p1  ORF type:complete len:163 (+),score=29.86 TRINITY_DN24441_c0_g2_i3:220-708(+)